MKLNRYENPKAVKGINLKRKVNFTRKSILMEDKNQPVIEIYEESA